MSAAPVSVRRRRTPTTSHPSPNLPRKAHRAR